ncbi:MAG: cytochrome d ubiquinol oxidase subunit II [Deltaproteobacteria bacterium]|nr:cytochrome d ubiquinol oxidase subunit II [Deltaproteobacteria bacterium]
MGLEHAVAAVMVGGLVLYVLGGGADFGGGLWDLLAFGPRKNEQRAVIERAIGPVWEANHVWFIFVFVLLFAAFPPAFTHLTTRFFDLLTAYAVGLVLRGSAFVFRHYERDDRKRRRYGALFSAASIGCPLLLGGMGALLVRDGELGSSFADPFVLAGAVFFLAVVAALAATYLTLEATDEALREDFRRRALGALVVAGIASWVALLAGRETASLLVSRVAGRGVAVVATVLGVAALVLLLRRRYELARAGVAMLAATVVIGWAVAKGEVLVPPAFTLTSSKAHDATLQVLLVACGLGAVILVPSLWLLFRIFAPIRRKGEVTRMGS